MSIKLVQEMLCKLALVQWNNSVDYILFIISMKIFIRVIKFLINKIKMFVEFYENFALI